MSTTPDLPRTGLRVLVAEDNPDDRGLVMWELRREFPGLEATEASDAAALARALDEESFDVVITDYHLGWTTGVEVLRAARARWPDCPVIVLTGTGSEETAVEAMKAGVDEYLIKSPRQFARLPDVVRSVMERARERRALREAESRYRSLFEGVPVGLYQTTPDGRFLDANPALAEMFGYPDRESLLTVNAADLYAGPEDRQRWRTRLEQEGILRAYETQYRRSDGYVITVRESARAVRDGEGRILYYEGVVEDISERKRAEEAAAALAEIGRALSETLDARFVSQRIADAVRALLRAQGSAVYQLEPASGNLTVLAVSAVGQLIFAPGAAVPKGVALVGLAVQERSTLATPDLLADPRLTFPADVRARIEHAGYRAALAVPLRFGNDVIGALAVVDRLGRVFDATEIRLAEAFADQAALSLENARLYEEVRSARDFLRSIVENSADGIVTTDAHGRITYFSPAAEAIFGYTAAEVLGQQVADYYPGEVTEAQAVMARLRAEGQVRNYETSFRAKDGRRVEISSSFSGLWDARGEIVGTVGVLKDISERKRAEGEIQRQREALVQREKVAAMGQLLAGVAHELNNPLSVVLGQTALLRQLAGGGPLAVRAQKIAQAAERCARIVKNFLALARQRPTERQDVALNQVVHEALELVTYPLRVDDVEVALELEEALPSLWADPHQLHQVMLNLVTNAHQAMRETPRPRRLAITTRTDASRARVWLDVADTGPGVPPELRARIFEPFFTTKPPGHGTGLGLALCQGIVEGHGGTIEVNDAAGGGACFRVELPVQTPPPAESEASPAEAAPPVGARRILVVDDEPDVAAVLADLLAAHGHTVETASNGAVALEMLRTRPYDLIMSDLKMPELDGPELYRQVKRHHPELRRRFVFLTGDTLTPATAEFLGQVGAPALGKPFALEEVRDVVQRVLRRT